MQETLEVASNDAELMVQATLGRKHRRNPSLLEGGNNGARWALDPVVNGLTSDKSYISRFMTPFTNLEGHL